jgi:hypothetical protein
MTTITIPRVRRVFAALAFAFAACTEPQVAERSRPSPSPSLDVRLDLSDSLPASGSEVVVTARLVGTPIASATARLLYDTAGVQFVREEPIDDAATRAMNPQPGVIRFAGVAANGFTNGRVYAWRFVVRNSASLLGLRLVVDEVHTVSHADAAASLSRKP